MSISARILRLLMPASVLLALWSPVPGPALARVRAADPTVPQVQPDLAVTDIWHSSGSICYQVMNVGDGPAGAGHKTELDVDGNPQALDEVLVNMAPGARLNRCFSYTWQCGDSVDIVVVWADSEFVIAEPDENNNGVKEIWNCDATSPSITSGPDVSNITTVSALVSWVTDENSDSLVKYGRRAGEYEGEASSPSMSKDHELTLKDLKPWSTYHYVVQSSDASGNTVTSAEESFETLPLPDSARPSIADVSFSRGPGDFLYYDFEATVTDDVGVERVEFYLDGSLIGTDYTPMTTTLTPVYEVALIPSALGLSREEFFEEHTVEVVAMDAEGFSDAPSTFDPPHECAAIDMHFISPDPDETFYMDGPVMPPDTWIPITVYAAEVTKGCEAGSLILPGWGRYDPCHDILTPVPIVYFYLNTIPQTPDYGPPDDLIYWGAGNASGLGPGTVALRADAYVSEECQQTAIRYVTLAIGERRLELQREVTRIDNYFQVQLTVQNLGTLVQAISEIEDSVAGFQPTRRSDASGQYSVTSDCAPDGQACDVRIDLSTEGDPFVLLGPGEELTVYYLTVPVLHPEPFEYTIGAEPVRILDSVRAVAETFDRPCAVIADGTELSRAVPLAQQASDYLIVTNPGQLFSLHISVIQVNRLLSAMAELARLKEGVLGYLSGPDAMDTRAVDDQIESWGSTMRGSDGAEGGYLSDGYLLLVGETEIVPALFFSYASLPWNWDLGNVEFTDFHYADTGGEWDRPNLSMGRIVSHLPMHLRRVIETSIDISNGVVDFDNSHAYAVSGHESGPALLPFVDARNTVADSLRDSGFEVEEDDCPDATTFYGHTEGRDVIFLTGHGTREMWDGHRVDGVDREFKPGDGRPLVYAASCDTGRYRNVRSLAEAFLQGRASGYVGATEIAVSPWDQRLAQAFFRRLEVGKTTGRAYRDAERHRWGANTWEWDPKYNGYTLAIFQLYGDPKIELTGYSPSASELDMNVSSTLATPVSQIGVTIPQYQVTNGVGGDMVEIPGGGMVMQPGQPSVPSYSVLIEYPAGQRVQDVALTGKEGLQVDVGLDIPPVFPTYSGESGSSVDIPQNDLGWWPDRDFNWIVHKDPDGSTTLDIEIYPFFYNSASTNVEFYTEYAFDIEATASPVEIKLLTTDQDAYPQGDDVAIDVWLNNPGQAQDVVVDIVVKDEGDNEVVDGLVLHTLHDLEGSASFSRLWDSSGHEPGYYAVEATLRDAVGNLLDTEVTRIRLGIWSGRITSFTATPMSFELGQEVDISLAFLNDGTVPISGTAVIQVQGEPSEIEGEFDHDISDLAPGNSVAFLDEWHTENAQEGRYRVLGYVRYGGTATEPAVTFVSTNPPLFLPVILKDS